MSLDPYWITALIGLARLALATGVLYGVASLVFPGHRDDTPVRLSEGRWARALLALGLPTLLAMTLVLFRIYDGLTFVGGLIFLAGGVLWWRYRHADTQLYVWILERADRPPSGRALWAAATRRFAAASVPASLLFGGILLGSAALRLVPLLQSPAPFSVTHYRLLEIAKHLQANQLFPGQLIETRGLHGLSVALHSLSGVDLDLVVRVLGVGAALLLVLGIYVAVRGVTRDTAAALGAGALFGLGLPLLPLALENQVEATPVVLATAFALPTWYFLLRYQDGGRRASLWIGGIGLVVVLCTDATVAALLGAVLLGLSLAQSVWAQTASQTRRALYVGGMSVGIGALLAGLALWRRLVVVPDPYAVPVFSVQGAGLPFYPPDLSILTYGMLVGPVALALIVGAAVTSSRRSMRAALALTCLGLYATWLGLESFPNLDISPFAPIALLSAFLSVAFGGLFAHLTAVLRSQLRRLQQAPALRFVYYGSVPGLLLTGVFLFSSPSLPAFDHQVEPDAYVRAVHEIQRVRAPYEWTVVSHHGTAARVMNRGRFLTPEYFLQNYDAETYDPSAPSAVPTKDLFLFVPTDSTIALVRDELLAPDRDIARSMQRWCEEYQRRAPLSLFYRAEGLKVYRLARPPRPVDLKPLISGAVEFPLPSARAPLHGFPFLRSPR